MTQPTPSDVEFIEVTLPVYTGTVDDRSPDYLDRDLCDFLSTEEREAINRVHLGSALINGTRTLASSGIASRSLFAQIAEEFARHQEGA